MHALASSGTVPCSGCISTPLLAMHVTGPTTRRSMRMFFIASVPGSPPGAEVSKPAAATLPWHRLLLGIGCPLAGLSSGAVAQASLSRGYLRLVAAAVRRQDRRAAREMVGAGCGRVTFGTLTAVQFEQCRGPWSTVKMAPSPTSPLPDSIPPWAVVACTACGREESDMASLIATGGLGLLGGRLGALSSRFGAALEVEEAAVP